MAKPTTWAVIENAGYDGENTRHVDRSYAEANRWADEHYTRQERADLNVDIAHWDHEQDCWSYDH